ncbi:helix-turn-helix domain-containing protein [Pandoraea apista]|uniref:XRE family transcriptional regulator n=1 Tax=Pandoraea apista TaxID=93218 RepID=A0ABX9ZHN5_9BURK|nr:helix-turn-helix transcriptional regulator [Pandoraea apista]PTE02687.1 hypothetical protein C7830_00225 [Pandoraea apista]RRJ27557.1 XRE family transcriptional regulator [Pandoraea apista]RRJ73152.1 XRE family transcriptional regulator [Pandoraea apista]RSD06463.1 XRE family transcriptional regulator [Pandoraea apista]RSD11294.1 XRE family transcriptional regulator [Pandoraea apista]
MVQEKPFAYVLRRLRETKGRWPDASAGSGVPVSTVRKIAQGQIANPRNDTVEALADYFHRLDEFTASNGRREEQVAA